MEENEHPVWAELRDMQAHERVSLTVSRRENGRKDRAPSLYWCYLDRVEVEPGGLTTNK